MLSFNFNKKIIGQRPSYNCRSGGTPKYCSAQLFSFIFPIPQFTRNPISHLKSPIYLSLEFGAVLPVSISHIHYKYS